MTFVYIIFFWIVAMIIYNIWTGRKKKERMTISKGGMKKYNRNPMTMSIGERVKRKKTNYRRW